MNSFTINRRLYSLNDVIAANRANKYKGATLKKDIEEAIGWDIKQALCKGELKPISNPCIIRINWYESSKRRDVDNVQSSQKFILDSLVKNGVLKNDSQRYVKQVYHEVLHAEKDYVEVELIEF